MPELAPTLVLLRGINVGGRIVIPMAELRTALSGAGLGEVKTHLQTGNLVVPSNTSPPALGARIEEVIENRFGLAVRAITRARKDLADLKSRNPFLEPDIPPVAVHTVFLETEPDPGRAARLDPDRSPPDRFLLSGREIFAHYPSGSGRSKLNLDYFERGLGIAGTARNWNTVAALLQMLGV